MMTGIWEIRRAKHRRQTICSTVEIMKFHPALTYFMGNYYSNRKRESGFREHQAGKQRVKTFPCMQEKNTVAADFLAIIFGMKVKPIPS